MNIRRSVNVMVDEAKQGKGSTLMNAPISDSEVQRTFEKGSNTPGPDNISANLIDFAEGADAQVFKTVMEQIMVIRLFHQVLEEGKPSCLAKARKRGL